MSECEHGCQFCYYEYFDRRAYPCSMCIYGEGRKDKFKPKGKQNKRIEDWLRDCVYHNGRSGYVTLPTDKVLEIADYIQTTRTNGVDGLIDLEVVEADHKTEPTEREGEVE